MFQVEIKNLKVKAHLGVNEAERKKLQSLLVTLRFKYNVPKKNQLDNIKFLKDYSKITKFIKKYIENSKCKTLEKLIVECSQQISKKFNIKKLYIKIDKIVVAKRYGCESLSVSQ